MAKCKPTPMMEQYLKIKEKYKYCLLFYRLGDFYELFFEDALIASRELEIALTGKDCGMTERAPMCGVPFHSAEGYVAKLLEKGYKVAICEQTEDPKKAKGIVKREVIRVITPGTTLDGNILEEGKNNYIMSLYQSKGGAAIAVCDVSTGELLTTSFKPNEESRIIDEIARFAPAELLAGENLSEELKERIERAFELKVEAVEEKTFDRAQGDICLCNHFKTLNLSGFGLDDEPLCVCALGALMAYLTETQKNGLSHITKVKKYTTDKYMVLDISSRRNLELTSTLRDKSKKGSLLWVLDKTKTAMGARLLRSWIEQPLIDCGEIDRRLDAVAAMKEAVFDRADLRELLNTVYDIERLMSRVVYGTANAKDLVALKISFENLPHIKRLLGGFESEYTKAVGEETDTLEDLYALIEENIAPEPPFSVREGGLIRKGANEEVDRYRSAKEDGSAWLMDLEAKEKELTGIKKLRIRYNKVFGYYIEVTNGNLDMVPDRYIRKQTLANCERYITPELKEIEETILNAEERLADLEYELFSSLRKRVADNVARIQKTAYAVSLCDVLQALAETAEKNGYIRPRVEESQIISIKGGRHPVVEQTAKSEPFIPNDTELNGEDNRLAIITGPNMAGKSTYMRQTALLVLMAQIGSFIPAESARIGITDRIFTRVGASDDLATGQSTFMVEMSEVANILNNATENSLLILDEIGRGTSTFDGLSIAWAVLENIALKIKARTLFATHYHELTQLEGKVDGVKNYCVSVKEQGSKVIFLRKIVKGNADRSYGVHVARLAGVPSAVTQRADEILETLGQYNYSVNKYIDQDEDFVYTKEAPQECILKLGEAADKFNEITEDINGLNINDMSPIEALNKLFELKEKVKRL